jgi:hypothetical protein
MVSVALVSILFLLLAVVCQLGLAKDLDASKFQTDVVSDNRVWLVEFYSAMCGSCTEFAPTWTKIEGAMKSIATGMSFLTSYWVSISYFTEPFACRED